MPFSRIEQKRLKALGERVRYLRKERNLTLEKLAHSIGKDPQSIHRLEQGNVNPSFLYLEQVCNGLQIELGELLTSLPER